MAGHFNRAPTGAHRRTLNNHHQSHIPAEPGHGDDNDRFPLAFAKIFQSLDAQREDEFTYTARLEVSDEATRNRIRTAIRAENANEAERLIALLDQNDWSVSVLVDTF